MENVERQKLNENRIKNMGWTNKIFLYKIMTGKNRSK